jgi:hypothetical protein
MAGLLGEVTRCYNGQVSEKSRKTYRASLARYFMWLYNSPSKSYLLGGAFKAGLTEVMSSASGDGPKKKAALAFIFDVLGPPVRQDMPL